MEPQGGSREVQRAAVAFAADHGFGKRAAKMAEHYPAVGIEKRTIRRTTRAPGERAFDEGTGKRAAATGAGLDPPWRRPGVAVLAVEYDRRNLRPGTLPPIEWGDRPVEYTEKRQREKRQPVTEWQPVNVGVVHEPGKVAVRYTARFGETDAAFDDRFGRAGLAGWSMNTVTRGIADGARPIRTQRAERFRVRRPATVACAGPAQSAFQFILDRPHAKETLMPAGEVLGPPQGKTAEPWADAQLEPIEPGRVGSRITRRRRLATQRETPVLRKTADYFAHNRDAVDYARFRAQGCSIGSGRVESAPTHGVQDRLKRPGRWWHPEPVDPMRAWRVMRVNHGWEAYWPPQAAAAAARAVALRQPHLDLAA